MMDVMRRCRTASEKMSNSPPVSGKANQPLVSVVMVVRDVERYLAEAIESILGQTFTDFELIILDFGSTDRSKEIAADYAARDRRISLHETPTCGLAEARNAGSALAQGKYIAVQDADDVSLADRLQCEVEFMEKHPEIGLLGTAAQWIDGEGKPLWVFPFPTEDAEIRSALATMCPFMHTSVLMRRDTFLAVGGYRAAFTRSQDYDLWLRIAERFRCANLKQILVKYRLHPHQASINKRKHQTYCSVAARASAAIRKVGDPDPLDSVDAITPELLTSLHVSPAELEVSLFKDNRAWVNNMMATKNYAVALQLATEMLASDWEYVERRQIARLQMVVARLYWKQKQYDASFFSVCHVATPAVAIDFGKALLRRISRFARA
jgi:hypothetical protein